MRADTLLFLLICPSTSLVENYSYVVCISPVWEEPSYGTDRELTCGLNGEGSVGRTEKVA